MGENEEKINPKTLDFIHKEISNRLDIQLQSVDLINERAGVIIGFIVVTLSIIFSIGKIPSGQILWLFVGGISFIFISLFFGVIPHLVQAYRRDPEPKPLREKYLLESDIKVKKQVVDNLVTSYEENKNKIKIKVRCINLSYIALLIGILLLILTIFWR